MFPAGFVGCITATGDAVVGPGAPTVLVGATPAACLGDAVTGAVCIGTITMGAPTVLAVGRPMARLTSTVTGANPITGAPVSTTVALGWPTVLVS